MTLASARTDIAVETSWLDELPAAGSAAMYEIALAHGDPACSRTLVRHRLLHTALECMIRAVSLSLTGC